MKASRSSPSAFRWLVAFLATGASLPLFSAALLARSGELTSLREVIERQNSDPRVLYGQAYTDLKSELKLATWQERRPQIVALGNSRVMQFRAGFFPPSVSFYNAGGLVNHLPDYRRALSQIPEAGQPVVLLVGIEHSFFNPGYATQNRDDGALFTASLEGVTVWEKHWREALRDLHAGKFRFDQIVRADTRRVGLRAVVQRSGFRADGSHRQGALSVEAPTTAYAARFEGSLELIRKGGGRFAYGDHIHPPALAEFSAFLAACSARGIHVVGFLPPFAAVTSEAMRAHGADYHYLQELPAALAAISAESGATFADFSDVASIHGTDDEMLNGNHGSEKTYLRMLLALAGLDSVLRDQLDLPSLRRLLSTSPGNLEVLPDSIP